MRDWNKHSYWEKMSKVKISIGMPTYNCAATVERAIMSVLRQTQQDWKLLVSDDFSTDNTRQIIARLAQNNPQRIAIVHPDENLYYVNFKHVLYHADTPYFVWLAGDDWWEPDFLERCLARLEQSPKAVACLGRCLFHKLDGETYVDPKARALEGSMSARVAQYLLDPDQTRMYGLFRRDALVASFPPRMCHAYDWCLCAGTLRFGTHVDVDEVLMNRERTPSARYLDVVDRDEPVRFLRLFPVLRMSWMGIRAGIIPVTPRVLAALVHINLTKHRQQMARRARIAAKILSPLYRFMLRATRWAAMSKKLYE